MGNIPRRKDKNSDPKRRWTRRQTRRQRSGVRQAVGLTQFGFGSCRGTLPRTSRPLEVCGRCCNEVLDVSVGILLPTPPLLVEPSVLPIEEMAQSIREALLLPNSLGAFVNL